MNQVTVICAKQTKHVLFAIQTKQPVEAAIAPEQLGLDALPVRGIDEADDADDADEATKKSVTSDVPIPIGSLESHLVDEAEFDFKQLSNLKIDTSSEPVILHVSPKKVVINSADAQTGIVTVTVERDFELDNVAIQAVAWIGGTAAGTRISEFIFAEDETETTGQFDFGQQVSGNTVAVYVPNRRPQFKDFTETVD